MNKRQFNEIHKMCRTEWLRLSRTGGSCKSDGLCDFINSCPACQIASMAANPNGEPDEITQDCQLCPVTKWRDLAIEVQLLEGAAQCERDGGEYRQWVYSAGKLRMKVAKEIADLEWSFLPEYKRIPVENLLIEARESIAKANAELAKYNEL